MLLASYVFYGWWDWRYVVLLVAVSAIAQVGAIAVSKQSDEKRRMRVVAIAVAATIAPLLYFKYYGFFVVNTANAASALGLGWTPPLIQVVLPVGISFYTFMAISYVVDVHRRRFEVASWTDVFLYLAFFPHLVAGPIVRPDELIPQLDVRRDQRHLDFAGAAWLILGGLFKKVVISSYLSTAIVEPVFGDPSRHSAIDAIVGVWAFAVVIYADFSGYTDIAIGVAQLLGFRFPQNFDRPYTAVSIQDFWRRWHMTLSRWLRDYLYIPLGGNRRGVRRTFVNLMITMRTRRPVARRRVELRRLGCAARRVPRDRAVEARRSRGRRPRGASGDRDDGLAATARGVPSRVPRLGLLPRGFDRHRDVAPRPPRHGMDDPDRAREPARAARDRRGRGSAVPSERAGRGAEGPRGARPAGAARHRGGLRAVPDHDARPAGGRAVHLLPVLRGNLNSTDETTTSGKVVDVADGAERRRPGPRADDGRPALGPRADDTWAAAAPPARLGMPAGRVLTVVVVSLAVWTLLFGPELKRSAEEQPLGLRRTVSIAVLTPFVWVSEVTGLASVTDGVGRAPRTRRTGRRPSSPSTTFRRIRRRRASRRPPSPSARPSWTPRSASRPVRTAAGRRGRRLARRRRRVLRRAGVQAVLRRRHEAGEDLDGTRPTRLLQLAVGASSRSVTSSSRTS